MTYEEALEALYKIRIVENLSEEDFYRHVECLRMCKIALKMQIPKKPKPYEHDYYLARCPTCYKDVPTHYVYGGVSFCENCGQPIDWSDKR